MLYLVQTFALPLFVALVGGLAVGWVTSDKEDEGPSPLAAAAMIAFALMVVAAALKWVPAGRACGSTRPCSSSAPI